MYDQLKIAIQYQTQSPESEFIKSLFPEADTFDPWKPPTQTYDIAICVGPVYHCLPAKKKVLFVMGETSSHCLGHNWDAVVVTSDKALVQANFLSGYKTQCRKIVPPVLEINAGKRRLVDKNSDIIHASNNETIIFPKNVKRFSLWERCINASLFSSLTYNSLIRGGAIGHYPKYMHDGYDLQVRRHLALGGNVICRKDPEVIGDLADLVCNTQEEAESKKIKPTSWLVTEDDYSKAIKELIGSL